MFAFELQPWTTIQGASTTTASPITQSELSYLDTSRYLDLVIWLETKAVSVGAGSLFCAFQTSASKDELLFVSMNDTSAAGVAMSVGVQVFLLLHDTAQYPLMHWLRWQLIPPASVAWSVTFRIWASMSRPGAIVDSDAADASSFNNGFEGGPDWTDAPPLMGTATPPSMPDNITHKLSNPNIKSAAPNLSSGSAMGPFIPHPVSKTVVGRDLVKRSYGGRWQSRNLHNDPARSIVPILRPDVPVTKK